MVSSEATFKIGERPIGGDAPCFLIAEAGVNHNGDMELAHRLIDEAADAGADAVKFQTFKAEKLASRLAPKADYQKQTTGEGESQLAMLQRLQLHQDDHLALMTHCEKRGILFLSSPFEEESADFLDKIGIAAFKIPSGELINHAFLTHLARMGRPMIVSTGMGNLDETREAYDVLMKAGVKGLALLHCVSAYPARPEDANLRAMQTLAKTFPVPVGWSDHMTGLEVAFASIPMGAKVIEKHFTLDKTLPGPDHEASMEPVELKALVKGVRAVEAAMGDGIKKPKTIEKGVADVIRKSLVAARDLPSGTVLVSTDIVISRPGTGLPPGDFDNLVGCKLTKDIQEGALFDPDCLDGF